MNKMFTTVLAFGAGMAVSTLVGKTNLPNKRQMKRMKKRISKAFF
ncbi:YrzQ family protein [Mesobacillus zeae]|uniref:DUF3918 domain-containing protein n=1 Tax=Mesobacillus zeae TaxID=1917180 RepID=A0A398B4K1_9BACI|nr:YrzQ family protein [Mesobacillus zeae]RID83748.1 DUF3918 domain-containing protein [Mesobacillus zeae]